MEKTLLEYGVVGAILLYFLWKDSKTFEIYRTTMQKIVDQLEAMQKDQTELKKLYAEWRKVSEEMLEEGFKGSIDCGDKAVREDFSNYAELSETISFEDMLELEKEYNKKEQD